jgi:dTDP-4-dehydrorhamnose 3,5-epimerase
METHHQEKYAKIGIHSNFVQDNLSFSTRGSLRGLHYQHPQGQDKLVQVVVGEIFDVVVDIRYGSPTFGKWIGVKLSDQNKRQFFIPNGFAHGFYVVAETAIVTYKCSDFYSPASERGILWSDPDLAIEWPQKDPTLSHKDSQFSCLKEISPERLPVY